MYLIKQVQARPAREEEGQHVWDGVGVVGKKVQAPGRGGVGVGVGGGGGVVAGFVVEHDEGHACG